jgi:hypothetical protein
VALTGRIPTKGGRENMVLRRVLPLVTMAIGVCVFQLSHAQPVRSCPDGQAVNSLNPNGTPVTCIPVATPSSVSALEGLIVQETAERKAADADIRANMSTNETSIVGRYTFSGTQSCINSSRNFNADFTPVSPPPFAFPPPPPPGTPPQPVVVPTTFVQHVTTTSAGTRTFNADGSGTSEFTTITVNHPGIVYTNILNGTPPQAILQATVSNSPASASAVAQTGTFRWRIENVNGDDKLIIDDSNVNGVITADGNRVGWLTSQRDLPNQVGVLGKDRKVITLTSEGPSVEITVLTQPPSQVPPGQTAQVIETPRVCQRHRVLTKISP